MASLGREIAKLSRQIAELQRKQTNIVRSGIVVDVDAANQRVIVDIGDEGNPLHTPWIRWPERAGARKTWNPPSAGEDMTVFSPSGEISKSSRAFPGGFTGDNAAPSGDGEATVYTFGPLTITTTAAGSVAEIGGVTAQISADGITLLGGAISHNGKNIGDTHIHKDPVPSPANTGAPV